MNGRAGLGSVLLVDDLGRSLEVAAPPARVVSLVPSITETLFALGYGPAVVGVTRFCVEPAAARHVPRVGGTKDPDVPRVLALAPDLVVANAEENRREDVEALGAAGVPVYVTFPRTVVAAIALIVRLGAIVGRPDEGRALAGRLEAERQGVARDAATARAVRFFCPIWKRPWMTFGADTFAHDTLATAGGANIFADLVERYGVVELDAVAARRPEILLLPSEPYPFAARDLDDLAPLLGAVSPPPAVCFVDGQAITWYGPRTGSGLRHVRASLRDTLANLHVR